MTGSETVSERVVSLVPSTTETLLAWGHAPVACTRFCEQPSIPVTVGGTKDPDIAGIIELAPDVVVMCPEENRRPDADALRAAGVNVHICSPRSVAEVPAALAELAKAVGARPPAGLLGGPAPEVAPLGVSAFVPIWRRPWMTIATGTYGVSVLDHLGVANIASTIAPDPVDDGPDGAAGRYPSVEFGDVAEARPDVILAPSEPYSFRPNHLEELRAIAPVVEVDGQDLFWWGVRTPAAVERLRTAIAAELDGDAGGR